MKAEEEIYTKIIDAIQDIGGIDATIDEISKTVPLGRHTLSKHLDHLRADGRVSYKQIGRAKVWFVSKSPLQHIFLLSEEEKTLRDVIGFDMGDILIYDPIKDELLSYAQIGYLGEETREAEEWK